LKPQLNNEFVVSLKTHHYTYTDRRNTANCTTPAKSRGLLQVIRMCVCIYARMHVYMCTIMYVCMYMCVCVCVRAPE